jgi:hypothetical protein
MQINTNPLVFNYILMQPARQGAAMNASNANVYDGYPKQELIEQAHLAAIAREKRERDEATRRQIRKLEEIILHQPNDFAD